MYKYRDIFDQGGQKVTTLGVRLWWSWPKLACGHTYSVTRLWLSYDLELDEEDDTSDWQVIVLDRFGDRLVNPEY